MRKKGIELSNAFPAILTLILVAILVIISIYIFGALSTSFDGTSDGTVINESGFLNASGMYLSKSSNGNESACGWTAATLTSVYNATGDVIIPSGNYTLSSAGLITNATPSTWSNVKIHYTYKYGGGACTASTDTIEQFGTYPALVGLVGTIIFLALVIGVLVASFAFGKKGV